MTQEPDNTGRLDDEARDREPSSTTDGPAAEGEYDPAQGSPDSGPHAVGDEESAGGVPRTTSDDVDS